MVKKLEKTLGLLPAVGLAITMVVGSGLLILPGLAYQKAGGVAVYAWLISSAVSIPLLIVFAKLGAELPGAGGIAGFMQASFSRRSGAATEILILGTIPGGAALAITGGKYLSALFNGNTLMVGIGTIFVLLIGGGSQLFRRESVRKDSATIGRYSNCYAFGSCRNYTTFRRYFTR